ncbi:MAG: YfcE family phosphodiesterase [Clostridia bacterium]|nr:YfcE family phosphodiesterase [Clostridia bacterium]
MRILVVSDSHGAVHPLREALALHPEASVVIHLGDGAQDLAQAADLIGERRTVQVCGNCDFGSPLPANALAEAQGVRIFCSHGHTEHVKYGLQVLCDKARAQAARIALYGHTHEPVTAVLDGLYLMNPGSIRAGSYGMIDLEPGGILCHTATLSRRAP